MMEKIEIIQGTRFYWLAAVMRKQEEIINWINEHDKREKGCLYHKCVNCGYDQTIDLKTKEQVGEEHEKDKD